MRLKLAAIAATSAVWLGSALGFAAPSHAAMTSVTVANCNAANLNGQTYNVASGDQLTLNFTTCSSFFISGAGSGPWSSNFSSGGNDFLFASPRLDAAGPGFSAMNAGTFVVYFRSSPSGSSEGSFTIVAANSGGGGGGGGSSSSSTSAGPADVFQQFGLPSTGTCSAAAPTSLNWAGVPSGGWGISWAQWMNGGGGGVVCTRTLSYREASGVWEVM